MKKLALALALVFGLVSCVFAETITVDPNYIPPEDQEEEPEDKTANTLAEALDMAEDESVEIEIVANITLEETIEFSDYSFTSLTIHGAGKSVTISEGRHFVMDNRDLDITLEDLTLTARDAGGIDITSASGVTFSRVTFSGLETDENGGAVNIALEDRDRTAVKFEDCTFTNCEAENGGAVYVSGGQVTFSGTLTTLDRNIASEAGGALYVTGGQVNFSGTETSITGNTSDGNGGALYVSGGSLTLSAGTIERSRAADNGGALYVESGQVTFSGSSGTAFNENEAENGGAVYFVDGTLIFPATVSFYRNTADGSGGALYVAEGSRGALTFGASVSFTENYANNDLDDEGDGGAVWWGKDAGAFDSTFQTTDGHVNFTGNEAKGGTSTTTSAGNGGAVFIVDAGNFVLTGTKYGFDGNLAYNYGGSIYSEEASVTLSGVNLTNTNTRDYNADLGGFLYSAASKLVIENSTLTGYRSEGDGGAVCFGKEGSGSTGNREITITTSRFTNNTASNSGGAVYISATTATVTDSYFDGNSAAQSGGALLLDGPCTATLTDNSFIGNHATGNNSGGGFGGAIYTAGPLYITTSYFNGNSAARRGGGVFLQLHDGNGIVSVTSSTFEANTASNGGALDLDGDEITINSCTFARNRAAGGEEVLGGAVYLSVASSNSAKASSVVNSTFVGNAAERGTTSGGGGLAIAGNVSVTSCAFALDNTADTHGGGIYIGNSGSSKQVTIAGVIAVGNSAPLGGDIFSLSDGGWKSGGYNRVGTYGTPNGTGTWEAHGGANTDKESINWTSATFFGDNVLAVNEWTATIPPYIGSTLSGSERKRLETLALNEAKDLPEASRATNIIPYTTDRYNFPRYDQRGRDRWANQADLDIGPVYFDGTRRGDSTQPITTYTIQSITMSGIPNTLKSVGTTASLIAIITYTNGRTSYGGSAANCEPVTWSSSASSIVYVHPEQGYIIAKAPGTATITVKTNRTTAGGVQASASRVVRVEAIPATYMNTVSQQYQNYFITYIEQIAEHDLSLSLVDASASSVRASSFQNNFKSVWPVSSAALVTNLKTSQPYFTTATSYSTNDGLKASKNAAVSINFQSLKAGDIFPLMYSWNFTGDEIKALLGADLTGQAANAALAQKLFNALRIDYQTANGTRTVLGSGGVSASDAMSAQALALSKADADRGVHIELTAYLANVAFSGSSDGPQLVKGAGSTKLLVVPDGASDGAITGTMWLAQKAAGSNTGGNTNGNTNTNTNTNVNGNGSGSGGGGGCESVTLGLAGALLLFMLKRR